MSFTLGKWAECSVKEKKGRMNGSFTLKTLILAGANFHKNLFLQEFIFAILTKIAKLAKICSHKIISKSKICKIFRKK